MTAGLVLVLVLVLAGAAGGTPPDLDAPVSATWRALPLRDWAGRVATILGQPVIVDRRLDPDTTVTRECQAEPVGDVLAVVAGAAGAAVEPLRSWIRIAPASVAGRATLGERSRTAEIATLAAPARTVLAARRAWSWPAGARPRDLVAAAVADAGLTLTGTEAVPHDHLPTMTLPPLALAERLDLLLAHYDLRVSWAADADAVVRGSIVPLPDAAGPGVAVDPPRTRRPGETPRPSPDASRRFTLTLEAPLDEALAAVAPQLGLVGEIDRASLAARGILPGEIVRAAVTDATREQLLDALVAPLHLRWRIEGDRLLIDTAP